MANEPHNVNRVYNTDGSVTLDRDITLLSEGPGITAPGLAALPADDNKPHIINENYDRSLYPGSITNTTQTSTITGAKNAPNTIYGGTFDTPYDVDTLVPNVNLRKTQNIIGGDAGDVIYADYVHGQKMPPTAVTSRDGTKHGFIVEADHNVILGGKGADYIVGGDGGDTIFGGGGPDKIYGGKGNNTISGGTPQNGEDNAPDVIFPGGGNNTVSLYNGDTSQGTGGVDTLNIYGTGVKAYGGSSSSVYINHGGQVTAVSSASSVDGYVMGTDPSKGEGFKGTSTVHFPAGGGELGAKLLAAGAKVGTLDIQATNLPLPPSAQTMDATATWTITDGNGKSVVLDQVEIQNLRDALVVRTGSTASYSASSIIAGGGHLTLSETNGVTAHNLPASLTKKSNALE